MNKMKDSLICGKCHAPGSCCKGFQLMSLVGWENPEDISSKVESALQVLNNLGIDFFVPYNVQKQCNIEYQTFNPSPDSRKAAMTWQCTRLKDGMCSDYENRPDLCKTYKPMSDDLCKVKSFKGIPIFYQQ